MRVFRSFLFGAAISLLWVVPVFAEPEVASSYNGMWDDGPVDGDLPDFRDPEPVIDNEVLIDIQRVVGDIYGVLVASPADAETADEVFLLDDPVSISVDGSEDYTNVLRYDVIVSGTAYTLLFSPDYIDQLYVDSNNRLWNMGTSNIQGLVVNGSFSPMSDTGTLVYLAPCLGNNYQTIHNGGSPNYFRRYYWTTSSGYDRLSYTDTYVTIHVEHEYFTFYRSQILTYGILFLLGSGVILVWLNRFRRY